MCSPSARTREDGLWRSAPNNPHIFEEKRLKISYKLGYSLEIL